MIWLRTHLLHALEWLSIRIQLPKDNPLRGNPHRFTFFAMSIFTLFGYIIFQRLRPYHRLLANLIQLVLVRNSRL